jgi:hypothetical protein
MAKLQIDGKDIADIDEEFVPDVLSFFANVESQVVSFHVLPTAPPPPMPNMKYAPSPWRNPYEVGEANFSIQWQKTRNEGE